MSEPQTSLADAASFREGRYGGFSFAGHQPEGVTAHSPLPPGTTFPNGAKSALLLTFDVEGTYGNGTGDPELEIANYRRICAALVEHGVTATFNVVGQMAEAHGPEFVEWMLDAGCEVAPHGYVHDMNRRHGGDLLSGGQYGPAENLEQVSDGIVAINRIRPNTVEGIRLPYGFFNEYSYDAIADLGLAWASHVGIDDMLAPERGFGAAPFQMQLGDKLYPVVEIPLDSQTYDWSIWMADEATNAPFVQAVRTYCKRAGIAFDRSPAGGVAVWRRRMHDAIEQESTFTLLCHPINMAVRNTRWGDPVDVFLLPVIEELGRLAADGQAWVCTCAQMAEFYRRAVGMGR